MRIIIFNVIGIDGVYISNGDDTEDNNEVGGQKGGQKDTGKTIDTILQLIKDNPSITRKFGAGEKFSQKLLAYLQVPFKNTLTV